MTVVNLRVRSGGNALPAVIFVLALHPPKREVLFLGGHRPTPSGIGLPPSSHLRKGLRILNAHFVLVNMTHAGAQTHAVR